jgi:hypothetical protein
MLAGLSDGTNSPPAPEAGEVPGQTVVDLTFEVVIKGPILGFTHRIT